MNKINKEQLRTNGCCLCIHGIQEQVVDTVVVMELVLATATSSGYLAYTAEL